ncbi:MAG: hypothetical protein ACR2IE_16160 [Candidatus Sumerlaeaceae bacterium]
MSSRKPSSLQVGFDVFERHAEYQLAQLERLLRASKALDEAGLLYGIVGGQAVAAHVSTVDPDAVRSTRDVDMLIRRDDLSQIKLALASAGFHYRHVAGLDMFLDGPHGKPSSGIHLVFAGERVRAENKTAAPNITETLQSQSGFKVITLDALVRMKLTSYRLKDQVHLQDLIGVGLIDGSWPALYPSPLRERLQAVIDNPDG